MKRFQVTQRELVVTTFEIEANSYEEAVALLNGEGDDDLLAAVELMQANADSDFIEQGADEVVEIVKTCSCGMTFTQADWEALPLLGYQMQFDENGDESKDRKLEMRNCSCKSTLTVEVAK